MGAAGGTEQELGWPAIVLWALGIWALLQIIRFFLVFQIVLKTELRRSKATPIPLDAIPPSVRGPLEIGIARLEALGFVRVQSYAVDRSQVSGDAEDPNYSMALLDEATGTYATILLADDADETDPFSVHFVTRDEDGQAAITGNGIAHAIIAPHPKVPVHDPLALDLGAQWAAHRARLASLVPGTPKRYEPIELASISARHLDECLDHGVASGTLTEVAPGRFRLRWRPAAKFAIAIIRTAGKIARYKHARAAQVETTNTRVTLPVEVVADAYRRQKRFLARQTPKSFLGWVFAITALLFVASFVETTGGVLGAMTLLGVVLLHELGHYLAMRAFGFADTTIFFLPFLGAAATGKKDDATASEEMIVLLAGPLPGMVLGALIFFFEPASGSWLEQLAITLFLLNGANLVPIFPFDGGRIAHLLLFGRSAISDVLFQVGGAGLLIAIAVWGDAFVLILPAALILIAIPTAVRTARIARSVAADEPGEEGVINAIDRTHLRALPFSRKANLARAIEKRLAGRRAGWAGTLGWGAVYGVIVALSTAGAVWTLLDRRALSDLSPMVDLAEEHGPPVSRLTCGDPIGPFDHALDSQDLLRLRCYGPKAARVEIAEELITYFDTSRTVWIVPPWARPIEVEADTRIARRTLAEVVKVRRRLIEGEGDALALGRTIAESWYYSPEELEGSIGARREERWGQLGPTVVEEAKARGASIDQRVIDDYLAVAHPSPDQPIEPLEARLDLYARTGGPRPTSTTSAAPALLDEYGVHWGWAQAGPERLELMIAPRRRPRALPELLGYLCRAGCERLEWR